MTDSEDKYGDWIKKIREAADVKDKEEVERRETGEKGKPNVGKEESNKEEKKNISESVNKKWSKKTFIIGLLIFLLAFLPRLYFIFFVNNPQNAGLGWYNDSYHHWQIAYLTQEIGLSHGFLRLWDLIGMEYFWGILNPLLLVLLFSLTGSADILVLRIVNTFLGSLSILVIFLLIKKNFNIHAALAAAILAVFNPVGIFTDTSGMQEPIAILMMLTGIYFWPKNPVLTALFWVLASMARSEYWLFSIGLIISLIILGKKTDKKIVLVVSYFGLILLYLKYLLDKTGNAIYPIYWNFMGNAKGEWQADIPLTDQMLQVRIIYIIILVISLLVLLFLFIRKPKLYLFSILGVGNFFFLSVFIGLTEYLKSYLPRFWVDRIFWLPYIWLGFVISILLLYYIPKYLGKFGIILGWALLLIILVLIQLAWMPIMQYSGESEKILKSEMELGKKVSSVYKEGSILLPGGDPAFTYALYKNGIKGKNIRGQKFDPYFYIEEDPYQNWKKYRKTVFDWLKKENIKLIIIDQSSARYAKLVEIEKDKFKKIDGFDYFQVYEVIDNQDKNL
ncbi:MAG: hypothetical protein Q7K55_00350 [Candidatus Levybacteria bacterium]|nr:hypothetical protein [Candidatus Levybacteria bacterium]